MVDLIIVKEWRDKADEDFLVAKTDLWRKEENSTLRYVFTFTKTSESPPLYLQPRIIWDYLIRLKSPDDLFSIFKG